MVNVRQDHLDLISKIYDLPLRPEAWPEVLDQFANVMNAFGSALHVQDARYAEHQVLEFSTVYRKLRNQDGELLIDQYNAEVSKYDQSSAIKLLSRPQRGFISEFDLSDAHKLDEYIETPVVQWNRQNFGVTHRAVSRLNMHDIWVDALSVQFSSNRGEITRSEIEIGDLFLDHFAKSIELSRSFVVLKSRFNGVFSALDRFHIGVFVLSPNGSVVVHNLEAERLLDAADGITLSREGQLYAADDSQRAELKAAITKAIHTAQAEGSTAETHMTVTRKSGGDDYLVEVAPIRDHEELEGHFGGALVFVIDPTKTDVVSTDGLQQLYGLTKSESEICKLVAEGLETDEVADARNLTRETVRTYIKQILQKTGVNNRAQLVRRALNVNLPIDPSPES